MLVLYALVAALIMGHSLAATNRRHFISTSGLFMLVALAISLIFDLDSPRVGGVVVPQAPMEHVAEQVIAAAKALPPPAAVVPQAR